MIHKKSFASVVVAVTTIAVFLSVLLSNITIDNNNNNTNTTTNNSNLEVFHPVDSVCSDSPDEKICLQSYFHHSINVFLPSVAKQQLLTWFMGNQITPIKMFLKHLFIATVAIDVGIIDASNKGMITTIEAAESRSALLADYSYKYFTGSVAHANTSLQAMVGPVARMMIQSYKFNQCDVAEETEQVIHSRFNNLYDKHSPYKSCDGAFNRIVYNNLTDAAARLKVAWLPHAPPSWTATYVSKSCLLSQVGNSTETMITLGLRQLDPVQEILYQKEKQYQVYSFFSTYNLYNITGGSPYYYNPLFRFNLDGLALIHYLLNMPLTDYQYPSLIAQLQEIAQPANSLQCPIGMNFSDFASRRLAVIDAMLAVTKIADDTASQYPLPSSKLSSSSSTVLLAVAQPGRFSFETPEDRIQEQNKIDEDRRDKLSEIQSPDAEIEAYLANFNRKRYPAENMLDWIDSKTNKLVKEVGLDAKKEFNMNAGVEMLLQDVFGGKYVERPSLWTKFKRFFKDSRSQEEKDREKTVDDARTTLRSLDSESLESVGDEFLDSYTSVTVRFEGYSPLDEDLSYKTMEQYGPHLFAQCVWNAKFPTKRVKIETQLDFKEMSVPESFSSNRFPVVPLAKEEAYANANLRVADKQLQDTFAFLKDPPTTSKKSRNIDAMQEFVPLGLITGDQIVTCAINSELYRNQNKHYMNSNKLATSEEDMVIDEGLMREYIEYEKTATSAFYKQITDNIKENGNTDKEIVQEENTEEEEKEKDEEEKEEVKSHTDTFIK